MKRNRYSEDFKRDMVRRLRESAMPTSRFAESVDIEHTMLYRWMKKYRDEYILSPQDGNAQRSSTVELTEVRKEIASIKQDMGILLNILRKVVGEKYSDLPEEN